MPVPACARRAPIVLSRADVPTHDLPPRPPDSVARFLERLPAPVALTGGTGFVGSHLVDTLCAAGLRPRVLVRDPASSRWIAGHPIDVVAGTLDDAAALERLVDGAGTVVHLAGVLTADRAEDFHRVNRDGTARLVDAVARGSRRRGSCTARPRPRSARPSTRPGSAPRRRRRRCPTMGARSCAASARSRTWATRAGGSIVRPPAIYGPRDTDVLEFFKMASRGVAVVPAGERWITVAHVADVVRGAARRRDERRAAGASTTSASPRRAASTRCSTSWRRPAGRRCAVVPLPAAAVGVVGAAAGLLRRAGLIDSALTRGQGARDRGPPLDACAPPTRWRALGVGRRSRSRRARARPGPGTAAQGWLR